MWNQESFWKSWRKEQELLGNSKDIAWSWRDSFQWKRVKEKSLISKIEWENIDRKVEFVKIGKNKD